MSRYSVPDLARFSAETRLRLALGATSVLLALALAALLSAVSLLRGMPPSPLMLTGIALGLCAELLCLDLALRRLARRLGSEARPPRGSSRPSRPRAAATPAVRRGW